MTSKVPSKGKDLNSAKQEVTLSSSQSSRWVLFASTEPYDETDVPVAQELQNSEIL